MDFMEWKTNINLLKYMMYNISIHPSVPTFQRFFVTTMSLEGQSAIMVSLWTKHDWMNQTVPLAL